MEWFEVMTLKQQCLTFLKTVLNRLFNNYVKFHTLHKKLLSKSPTLLRLKTYAAGVMEGDHP